MDIANLQAFTAVADNASFSLAAEQLHLTQPAISKRISALETELDTCLFDRLGRRVLLTEAGYTLLPRARRILAELEDSRRALRNLSGHVTGSLSLATSHHIGLHRLPPVLRVFASRYGQVQLDMRFMDSELACAAVVHGDVELGIVTLPLQPPVSLQTLPLWTDRLLVVANRVHPLARQRRITPHLLSRYPAILPGEVTFTRSIIDQLFEPLNLRLTVAFATNYLETIKMMVAVGLGWSILPHTMLDRELIALDVEGLQATRRLGAVRHTGRTSSNAAQAMLAILHDGSDELNNPNFMKANRQGRVKDEP
jgi:DNA-binding transcriptional LysR family regulator